MKSKDHEISSESALPRTAKRSPWWLISCSDVPNLKFLILFLSSILFLLWSPLNIWLYDSAILSKVSFFQIGYGLGPLVFQLNRYGQYAVFDGSLGIPFAAHRMPLMPLFFWFSTKFISTGLLANCIFKNLVLGPLWGLAVIRIAWHRKSSALLAVCAVCLAFVIPLNGIVATHVEYEEGFLFYLFAILAAYLLVRKSKFDFWIIGLLIALIYLTKSSLLPVCAFVAFVELLRGLRQPTKSWFSLLPIIFLLAAISGWGAFTLHRTGRFAFGANSSSYNGWNLMKGNNQYFRTIYPERNLDMLDATGIFLPSKQLHNEWEWNDYCTHKAIDFIKQHPKQTFNDFLVKVKVGLFSVSNIFAGAGTGGSLVISMIPIRLLLWGSVIVGFWQIRKGHGDPGFRWAPLAILLGSYACFLAPYFIGFLYYRHILPLVGVSILFLLDRLSLLLHTSNSR